jgi:hypothetical protein
MSEVSEAIDRQTDVLIHLCELIEIHYLIIEEKKENLPA